MKSSDNTIVIIDYDMGNLGSIINMIKKVGGSSILTRNQKTIANARKIILPGDGSFDNGMSNLKKFGLLELLNLKVISQKIPILGICLGMQLFSEESEEGTLPGLSWINAKTVKFKFQKDKQDFRIPHMGWNNIKNRSRSLLLNGMPQNSRFYFVHSYHLICNNKINIAAQTNYGYDFASIIETDNIFGTQFHPEKSHRYGMIIYSNFLKIKC